MPIGLEYNMDKIKCFRYLVLAPHRIYNNLDMAIADTLQEVGFKPILLEGFEIEFGRPFAELIQNTIEHADIIIADLTGNNPNVMYEVGFAHALRKPVLLLVQGGVAHVPSDMAGYLYIVYDPSNLIELRNRIKNWAIRYTNKLNKGDVPK